MGRRWFAAVGLVLAVVLSLALPAAAGDAPPPDALDGIRDAIPEGFPGERDLTEADAEFRELVSLYGESTGVDDFGSGSELTGQCGGYAYSYDEDGKLLDAAADFGGEGPPVDLLDGGQAMTAGNPFKVDTNGIVAYYGFFPQNGDGPLEHNWQIKTGGVSLDKGGDPNPNAKNRSVGIVDLAKELPVKFNAKTKVEGSMTSENLGPCAGRGHIEFRANPLTNPIALAGLAALAGGIFGLLFNARPAMTFKGGSMSDLQGGAMSDPTLTKKTKPVAGALWGVLLGIGLALWAVNLKLVSLSFGPFLVTVVIGVVLGVAWAMVGPAKKSRGDHAGGG